MAAHVLPVAIGHPAKNGLALLQQLGKDVARPVRDLAALEILEHSWIQDVDAGVGEVAEDLAPGRFLEKPLHAALLVGHHHPVLERVGHGLEHDGRHRLPLSVEAHRGAEVDVGEGVAADHHEGFAQLVLSQLHRPRRTQRCVLDGVAEVHALLRPVAEVVADVGPQVLHSRDHLAHLVAAEQQQDVLHDRPARHRHEGLRALARQRPQPGALPARHDHGPHAPSMVVPCRLTSRTLPLI